MAQDLGGFTIARSTSVTMLLIFSVYSIIIVGFGFYVKAQAGRVAPTTSRPSLQEAATLVHFPSP